MSQCYDNEKIDCFSFGVIIIQTLTRQFPNPRNRWQEIEINHPGLPRGIVAVHLAEIDCRQNHISQVDQNHPLLPIAWKMKILNVPQLSSSVKE